MSLHIEASHEIYISDCKAYQRRAADLAACDSLIEKSLLLVVYLASKYYRNSSLDLDDLIQVGNMGLLQAIRYFNPQRSTKFSAYAAQCIRREMYKFAVEQRREKEYLLSLEHLWRDHEEEDQDVPLKEIISQDLDFEEHICSAVTIRKFLAYLPPQEQHLLCLHFGLNEQGRAYSYNDLVPILKLHHTTIKKRIEKALQRLRGIARNAERLQAQP